MLPTENDQGVSSSSGGWRMEREKKGKLKMTQLEWMQVCGLKACLGEEPRDPT